MQQYSPHTRTLSYSTVPRNVMHYLRVCNHATSTTTYKSLTRITMHNRALQYTSLHCTTTHIPHMPCNYHCMHNDVYYIATHRVVLLVNALPHHTINHTVTSCTSLGNTRIIQHIKETFVFGGLWDFEFLYVYKTSHLDAIEHTAKTRLPSAPNFLLILETCCIHFFRSVFDTHAKMNPDAIWKTFQWR